MLSVAAKIVRSKLSERGWNHADLARAMKAKGVHVAEGLVSRWLSGQRTPNRERSAALEDILGVSPKLWNSPTKKKVA